MAKSPTKPFAISKHEQYVLICYLNPLDSADQEERRSRRDVWDEFSIRELKRVIDKVPTEQNPNPVGAIKLGDWADDEPNVRLELHGATINYVIKKLGGKLNGSAGDILGELSDRLAACRDTTDDRICTSSGTGYRLPEALWTADERAADSAAKAPKEQPPELAVAAG